MHKINKTIKSKHKAFSLVEVLISLLIFSVIMVALAPVITKKVSSKKTGGVVFAYKEGNKVNRDSVCYTTGDTYSSTRDCSEYTFTVPDGVHSVDLTLVAGGGGGGGAAAGFPSKFSDFQLVDSTISSTKTVHPERLENIKINFLVAQGQTGDEINTNCALENGKCGGKGGDSSYAIYDFNLPKTLIKKGDFSLEALTDSSSTNNKLTLGKTANSTSLSLLTPSDEVIVSYSITKNSTSPGYSTSCTIDGTTYTSITDARCLFPSKNLIKSKSGNFGQAVNKDDTVYKDSKLIGGTGASIKGISYGAGGMGAAASITCSEGNTCQAENATYSTSVTKTSGTNGGVSVDYELLYPGGTGGGGAAGTVVKIKAFPVTPGEKYTVLVGKGGTGGMSGASAVATGGAGASGNSGVSSAIYKTNANNETLVYMVNGGVGGTGGTYAQNTARQIAASGRHYPVLFTGNNSYFNNLKLDESKVEVLSSVTVSEGPSDTKSKVLSYPILDIEPYKSFIKGLPDTTLTNDNKTGGFSGFRNTIEGKTLSINGNSVSNLYDGFYYRSLANGIPSYVGGLGGHTGFGSKGGCGGYFMGNFDGRQTNTTASDDVKFAVANKFVINTNMHDVFTYYDNCNFTSPDGKTAEFIPPDPVAQTYGQAGAGGGGGGWNSVHGAGKGGDGQNGYVMINWQK